MELSIPTAADVVLLAAIIAAMFVADTQMAAIALAPAPLMILAMFVWQRRAKPTFIRIRSAISVVNANLQEGITGPKYEPPAREFASI